MSLRDLDYTTRRHFKAVWKEPMVTAIVFASRHQILVSLEKVRGRGSIQPVHSKRRLG